MRRSQAISVRARPIGPPSQSCRPRRSRPRSGRDVPRTRRPSGLRRRCRRPRQWHARCRPAMGATWRLSDILQIETVLNTSSVASEARHARRTFRSARVSGLSVADKQQAVDQVLADACQSWSDLESPRIAQTRTDSADQNWPGIGQTVPGIDQHWPESTRAVLDSAKIGPESANVVPESAQLGPETAQIGPNSVKCCPKSNKHGSTLFRYRPNLGHPRGRHDILSWGVESWSPARTQGLCVAEPHRR